jgi:putative flippase GtrA
VDVWRTALDDLRGIVRLLASARLTRFAVVGVCSTLAYGLLFLALRGPVGVALANAIALAVTAIGNTQANRWLTFGLRGREGLIRQHVMGAFVYVLTLGLTVGALGLLRAIDPSPSRAVELAVLLVASASATVTRYIALRTWVFARDRRPGLFRRTAASIARVGL